jgi:hypothetical protein
MPGTRHKATVSESIQQAVNAVETVKHTELLLDPAPEIFPATNTIPWVFSGSIQVLHDLLFFGIAQMAMIAALPPVGESGQPIPVVTANVLLQRPAADAQRLDNLWRRIALLSQNDDL